MILDPLKYYQTLGVDYNVDDKILKICYREKAKFWHPDHNKSPDALENFQKISLAYDVLKDSKLRTIYNLLALAYDAQSFPDMKSLKIYKSVNGDETPFLRVLLLKKVSAKLNKVNVSEEKPVGTFNDALKFVADIAKHNWLKGWWALKAPAINIAAIKQNIKNINQNREDNFKLLIHNAAAFYDIGNLEKAYLSAYQAQEYAPQEYLPLLQQFIALLPRCNIDIPQWDYNKLKNIQLKLPKILAAVLFVVVILGATPFIGTLFPKTEDSKIAYYQEVRFNSGQETVDDVVVSKIFNVPVDTSNTSMLYHLRESVDVMYGPSENFDVMDKAKRGQTVRVTGYTPDQEWFRVMLDNGEMGFIKKQYLKQGMGLEIPQNSKIFEK